MEIDNPTPSGVGAVAPRYTSMRRNEGESESELSGELWVVSGNFGVKKKKAWVVVNYATKRLSIYSSYSRDHSKLLDDVDFKLIVKLFWFTHDSNIQSERSSTQKPHRFWYFGLELVKEPGGTDHHYPQEPGKQQGTMRDRRSEVVIFCSDVKEHYAKWEAFLGGEENMTGGVVVSNREDARIYENNDRIVDLTNNFESELAAMRASHERELQQLTQQMKSKIDDTESQYTNQLNDVVARSDHERMISTFTIQKKEFQTREVQFQEGLKFAQTTIKKLTVENSEFSGKYTSEITRLEDVIRDQEAERRDLQSRLQLEKERVTILTREVTDRVREDNSSSNNAVPKRISTNDDLDENVRNLEAQVAQLKANNKALMSQITDSAKSNISDGSDQLSAKIQELEDDNCKLVMLLQETQEELSNKDEQLSFTGEAMDKAADEIEQQRELVFQIHELLQAEFPNDIRAKDQLGTMGLLVDLIEAFHSKQSESAQSFQPRDESETIRLLEEGLEVANNSLAATSCELSKATKQLITRTNELMAAEKKVEQLGGHTSPRESTDKNDSGNGLQSRIDALTSSCDEKDRKVKLYGDRIRDLEKKLALLVIGEGDEVGVEEKSSSIESVVTSIQSQAEVYKAKFEEQQVKSREHEEKLELLINELNRAKAENGLVLSALKNDHDMDMSRLSCLSDAALQQLTDLTGKQHSAIRDKLLLEETTIRSTIESDYNNLLVDLLVLNLHLVRESMVSISSLIISVSGNTNLSIADHISSSNFVKETSNLFNNETLCRFDIYSCFEDNFISFTVAFNAGVVEKYQSVWGQLGSIMNSFGPSSPSRDPATHVKNKADEYAQALSDINAVLDCSEMEAAPFEISKNAILQITRQREDSNLALRKTMEIVKKVYTANEEETPVLQQVVTELGHNISNIKDELLLLSGSSEESINDLSISELVSLIKQNTGRLQTSLTTEITSLASTVSSATSKLSIHCGDNLLNISELAAVVSDKLTTLQQQNETATTKLQQHCDDDHLQQGLEKLTDVVCDRLRLLENQSQQSGQILSPFVVDGSESLPEIATSVVGVITDAVNKLTPLCDESCKSTLGDLSTAVVTDNENIKKLLLQINGEDSLLAVESFVNDFLKSKDILSKYSTPSTNTLTDLSETVSQQIDVGSDLQKLIKDKLFPFFTSSNNEIDIVNLTADRLQLVVDAMNQLVLFDDTFENSTVAVAIEKLIDLLQSETTIREVLSNTIRDDSADIAQLVSTTTNHLHELNEFTDQIKSTVQTETLEDSINKVNELESIISKVKELTKQDDPNTAMKHLVMLTDVNSKASIALNSTPTELSQAASTAGDILQLLEETFAKGEPSLNAKALSDLIKSCSDCLCCSVPDIADTAAATCEKLKQITSLLRGVPGDDPIKLCSQLVQKFEETTASNKTSSATFTEEISSTKQQCADLQSVVTVVHEMLAAKVLPEYKNSDLESVASQFCLDFTNLSDEMTAAKQKLQTVVKSDSSDLQVLISKADQRIQFLENENDSAATILKDQSTPTSQSTLPDMVKTVVDQQLSTMELLLSAGFTEPLMTDRTRNAIDKLTSMEANISTADDEQQRVMKLLSTSGLPKQDSTEAMIESVVGELLKSRSETTSALSILDTITQDGVGIVEKATNAAATCDQTSRRNSEATELANNTNEDLSKKNQQLLLERKTATVTLMQGLQLSQTEQSLVQLASECSTQMSTMMDTQQAVAMKLAGDLKGLGLEPEQDDGRNLKTLSEDVSKLLHTLHRQHEFTKDKLRLLGGDADDSDFSKFAEDTTMQMQKLKCDTETCILKLSAVLPSQENSEPTLTSLTDVLIGQYNQLVSQHAAACSALTSTLSTIGGEEINYENDQTGTLPLIVEAVQKHLHTLSNDIRNGCSVLESSLTAVNTTVESNSLKDVCGLIQVTLRSYHTNTNIAIDCLRGIITKTSGSMLDSNDINVLSETATKSVQQIVLNSATAVAVLQPALAPLEGNVADFSLVESSEAAQRNLQKFHLEGTTVTTLLRSILSVVGVQGVGEELSVVELSEMIQRQTQKSHNELISVNTSLKSMAEVLNVTSETPIELVELIYVGVQKLHSENHSATALLRDAVVSTADSRLLELVDTVLLELQKSSLELTNMTSTLKSILPSDSDSTPSELAELISASLQKSQDDVAAVVSAIKMSTKDNELNTSNLNVNQLVDRLLAELEKLQTQSGIISNTIIDLGIEYDDNVSPTQALCTWIKKYKATMDAAKSQLFEFSFSGEDSDVSAAVAAIRDEVTTSRDFIIKCKSSFPDDENVLDAIAVLQQDFTSLNTMLGGGSELPGTLEKVTSDILSLYPTDDTTNQSLLPLCELMIADYENVKKLIDDETSTGLLADKLSLAINRIGHSEDCSPTLSNTITQSLKLLSDSDNETLYKQLKTLIDDNDTLSNLVGGTASTTDEIQKCKRGLESLHRGDDETMTISELINKLMLDNQRQSESDDNITALHEECQQQLLKITSGDSDSPILTLSKQVVVETQKNKLILHSDADIDINRVLLSIKEQLLSILPESATDVSSLSDITASVQKHVSAISSILGDGISHEELSMSFDELAQVVNSTECKTLPELMMFAGDYIRSIRSEIGCTELSEIIDCKSSLQLLLPSDDENTKSLLEVASNVKDQWNDLIGEGNTSEMIKCKNDLSNRSKPNTSLPNMVITLLDEAADLEKCAGGTLSSLTETKHQISEVLSVTEEMTLVEMLSAAAAEIKKLNTEIGCENSSEISEYKKQLIQITECEQDNSLLEIVSLLSNDVTAARDVLLANSGETLLQAAEDVVNSQMMALHILTGSESRTDDLCEAAIAIKATLLETIPTRDDSVPVKELVDEVYTEITSSKETLRLALNETEVDVGGFSPQQVSIETCVSDLSRKTVSVLTAEVRVVRSEVSNLHQQLDELQEVHEAKERLLSIQLGGENDGLSDQLTDQLRENQDLQKQLLVSLGDQQLLSDQLSAAKEKIKQIENDLQSNDDRFAVVQGAFTASQQTLIDKVNELQTELSKAKSELDASENESQENLSELSKTQVDLLSKKQLYESLRSELDCTNTELSSTREELKEFKQKSANTRNELLNEIESINQEKESSLQLLVDRLQSGSSAPVSKSGFALERLTEAIEHNISQHSDDENLERSIRSQLEETIEERDYLKKEVEQKLIDEQTLRSEKDKLEESILSELETTKGERDDLKQQIEQHQQDEKTLQSEKDKLEESILSELQETKEERDDLKQQIEQHQQDEKTLQGEKDKLEESILSELQETKEERDDLRSQVENASEELDSLKAESDKLRIEQDKSHTSMQRSRELLKNTSEDLETKLQRAHDTAQQKEQTTVQLQQQVVQSLESISSLKDVNNNLQSDLESSRRHNQSLSTELSDIKSTAMKQSEELSIQLSRSTSLEKQLFVEKSSLTEIELQHQQMLKSNNDYQEEVQQLSIMQSKLQRKLSSLDQEASKVPELESTTASQADQLKSLQRELSTYKEDLDFADSKVTKLKNLQQQNTLMETELASSKRGEMLVTQKAKDFESENEILREDLKVTKSKVSEVRSKNQELVIQLSDLKERVAPDDFDMKLKSFERRATAADEELLYRDTTITRLKGRLQELEGEDVSKASHIAKLTIDCNTLEARLLQMQDEQNHSRAIVPLAMGDPDLEIKHERLQAEVTRNDQEIEILRTERRSLKEQVSNLQDTQMEASLLKQKHASNQEQIAGLENSLQKCEQRLRSKHEEITNLAEAADDEKRQRVQAERTAKDLETQVENISNKLSAKTTECDDTAEELHQQQKQQQSAEREKEVLDDKLSHAQDDNKKKQQLLSEQNQTLEESQSEITKLQYLIKELKEEKDSNTQKTHQLQHQLESSTLTCESAEKKCKELTSQLEAHEEVEKKLTQGANEVVEERDSAVRKSQHYQQQLEATSLDQESAQKKCKELISQLETSEENIQKLNQRINETTEERDSAIRKLHHHQQQLEATSLDQESAQKKCKELLSQLEASEEKIQKLNQKNNNFSTELDSTLRKLQEASAGEEQAQKKCKEIQSQLQASEENLQKQSHKNNDVAAERDAAIRKLQEASAGEESAQKKCKELLTQISTTDDSIQKLSQKNNELTAEKDSTLRKLQDALLGEESAEKKLKEAQTQLQSTEDVIKKVSQSNSDLTEQLSTATDKNKQLQGKVTEAEHLYQNTSGRELLQQEISQVTEECRELAKQLQDSRKQIQTLNDDKQSLEFEIQKSQRELSASNQSTLDLTQQLTASKQHIESIQNSLTAAGSGEDSLKKEISRLSNLLETQEDDYTHKSSLQKKEASRLSEELQNTLSEHSTSQQKLQQLRQQHQQEVKELRKEASDILIKLNALNVDNATLTKQLQVIESESATLREKVQKQKDKLFTEQEASEKLQTDCHHLKQENSELKHQLQTASEKTEMLRSEIAAFGSNTEPSNSAKRELAECETRLINITSKYSSCQLELAEVHKEIVIVKCKAAETEGQLEVSATKLLKTSQQLDDLSQTSERDATEVRRLRSVEEELQNISSKLEILLPVAMSRGGVSPISTNSSNIDFRDDDISSSSIPRNGSVVYKIYKFINMLQEVLAEAESFQTSSRKLETQANELRTKVETYRAQERRAMRLLSENTDESQIPSGCVIEKLEKLFDNVMAKRQESESELTIVSSHTIELENTCNELTTMRNEETGRHHLSSNCVEEMTIIQRSMESALTNRILYLERILTSTVSELQKQSALMEKSGSETPKTTTQVLKLTPSTQRSTPWLLKGWGDVSTHVRSPRGFGDCTGDDMFNCIAEDVAALCTAYNKAIDQVPANEQYQEMLSRYEVEVACKDQEIQRITRESISRASRASSVDPTLAVQLRASESRVQELEFDVSDLKLQLDKITTSHSDEISQQNIKIDQLETELAITRRTEAETQSTLTSVTRQLNIAEEALSKTHSSVANSKASSFEIQQLKSDVERYESTIRDYDSVALQLRVRHEDMKKRITELEIQVAIKDSKIQQLTEDLSRETASLATRCSELRQIVQLKVAEDEDTVRKNMLVEAHNKRVLQPSTAVHPPNTLPRGPTPPPRLTFHSLSNDYGLPHVSHP